MTNEITLRDYQQKQLKDIKKELAISKKPFIIQGSTGSGKNHIMAHMVDKIINSGQRVMFMVRGRSVVDQFSQRLKGFNLPHTMMMAGHDYYEHEKAVVASADSLHSWYFKDGSKMDKDQMRMPDYVFIDECRFFATPKNRAIIKHFESHGSAVIGFDATPTNKGLGLAFSKILMGESTKYHISRGNLCPITHYSPAAKDREFMENLKGMRQRGGDYSKKDMDALMNKKVLIGDIVDNYEKITQLEYGERKPFVVSCVSKDHAKAVAACFDENGMAVEYVDGDTKTDQRMEMFDRVTDGTTLGIISIMTMAFGVDLPALQIGIIARPTKNLALYLQYGGRILRPLEDKTHATLIDHSGVVQEHGYLDDEYVWNLNDEKPINKTREDIETENKDVVEITCKECGHVYHNSKKCPVCGHANIVGLNETNVVYLNTALEKALREEQGNATRKAENREWVQNMKALIFSKPWSDVKKQATLESICAMRFKRVINYNAHLKNIDLGLADSTAIGYYRHYNIRNSFRGR